MVVPGHPVQVDDGLDLALLPLGLHEHALRVQPRLEEHGEDEEGGEHEDREAEDEGPSPGVVAAVLVVVLHGAADGHVALAGHDGGHVDGVVEDAVLGGVEDEGEEDVREVGVDVDVLGKEGNNIIARSFKRKVVSL